MTNVYEENVTATFTIDGDEYQYRQGFSVPHRHLLNLAGLDLDTHYLFRMRGRRRYNCRGKVLVTIQEGDRFVSCYTGP